MAKRSINLDEKKVVTVTKIIFWEADVRLLGAFKVVF